MVVAHRIVPLTYWIIRGSGSTTAHLLVAELLAGREVCPSSVQEQVRPDVLGHGAVDFLAGNSAFRLVRFVPLHPP
jgi:lipid A disaccharide synthetase